MARPDTRPVAILPERGNWFLLRWKEYNGHFIAMSKNPAGVLRTFQIRCARERELLEVVDVLHIEVGPPPHGYLAQMSRDRYRRMLDEFRFWAASELRMLVEKKEQLPEGFDVCRRYVPPEDFDRDDREGGRRYHSGCRTCGGLQITASEDWRVLFDRAGDFWLKVTSRDREAYRTFRPFDIRRPPLVGAIEYATKGGYGIDFSKLPDQPKDFRFYSPEVLFFFVRRAEGVTIPGLAEFIDGWSSRDERERAKHEERARRERREYEARRTAQARAAAAALTSR